MGFLLALPFVMVLYFILYNWVLSNARPVSWLFVRRVQLSIHGRQFPSSCMEGAFPTSIDVSFSCVIKKMRDLKTMRFMIHVGFTLNCVACGLLLQRIQ